MILLKQNIINRVSLSLDEGNTLLTGDTPSFLFQFTNQQSNVETLFTVPQISGCSRTNNFDITVSGGTENLTGGTINLPIGNYNYNIYSMTGATNLDISGTTQEVETGLCYVSGVTTPNIVYDNNDNTNIVYNG